MRLPIEYAQNIIVGVVNDGDWRWYVTDRQLWVLDLDRYERAFESGGYQVPFRGQYPERFGIGVVDRETSIQFLQCIEEFSVTTEELRTHILIEEDSGQLVGDEWYKFIPALLVDFDTRRLLSLFPEPLAFEHYVPSGWVGSYDDFLPHVPPAERYWMVDGIDYFAKLGG